MSDFLILLGLLFVGMAIIELAGAVDRHGKRGPPPT